MKMAKDYRGFFKDTFGREREPYAHQLETIRSLAEGRSVILRAPTGSGKTEAALGAFLFAINHDLDFPKRALYSVPIRVLAKQLKERVEKATKEFEKLKTTIQTGENPEDPYFTGDFVLTTIDQLLSAYLHIPLSLSDRLSNVNAGAVISSFLIFDEFHLYDRQRALKTMVYLVNDLLPGTPFALMTATVSDAFIEKIQKDLGVEFVSISENPVDSIKVIDVSESPMNGEEILRRHKKKTLVICNTVGRAIEIYKEIARKKSDKYETLLLHSRFYPSDRANRDEKAIVMLGKNGNGGIIVTTQVVEVGMDISADILWTEAAPADSIIQRAGRCARWKDEEGEVIICPVKNANTSRGWLPYIKEDSDEALRYLRDRHGQKLDWPLVVEMVNKLLSNKDIQTYQEFISDRFQLRNTIAKVIRSGDRSFAPELIRNVDSRQIILTDYPTSDNLKNPFNFEWIPISSSSLYVAKSYAEENGIKDWLWIPVIRESNEDEVYTGAVYDYKNASNQDFFYYPQYIVSPRVASYSDEYGLELGMRGENLYEIPSRKKGDKPAISFHLESLDDHVDKLVHIYDSKFKRYSYFIFKRIAENLDMTPEDLESLQLLVIVFHDTGKLSEQWQKIAHNYQKNMGYGKNHGPDTILAHTDYQPGKDKFTRFPEHAVAGAFATRCLAVSLAESILPENPPILYPAYLMAVSRHHSPQAINLTPYDIRKTKQMVEKLFAKYFRFQKRADDITLCYEQTMDISNYFFDKPDEPGYKLYEVLVRNLRLCELHYGDD
jgi:CRISPR-associated endonuclease/helicase Cas3